MMHVYGKILNGTLVCLMLLLVLITPTYAFEESTVISVYPSASYVEVGSAFNVNVTVSNVYDLVGWEFKLYYLSAKLNGTSVAEGPFLKQGGNTFFYVVNFTDNYNATHGMVWLTCTLLGAVPGVSGNGTLATITFRAREPGSSSLMLKDTLLSDSKANPIAHSVMHGTVYILIHDVAIVEVSPSKTIVGQGFTVKISVTLRNDGNYIETLNVTVYVNATVLKIATVTITNGSSVTLDFTWDTSSFICGNYTIKAYAWPVKGEEDVSDNLMSIIIFLTIPGDVDGDGRVDLKDLVSLAIAYGSSIGTARWNANADINGNLKVDLSDLVILAKNYGRKI
jgi:acyl-coenzyme A thioesterase PaaI-like protein